MLSLLLLPRASGVPPSPEDSGSLFLPFPSCSVHVPLCALWVQGECADKGAPPCLWGVLGAQPSVAAGSAQAPFPGSKITPCGSLGVRGKAFAFRLLVLLLEKLPPIFMFSLHHSLFPRKCHGWAGRARGVCGASLSQTWARVFLSSRGGGGIGGPREYWGAVRVCAVPEGSGESLLLQPWVPWGLRPDLCSPAPRLACGLPRGTRAASCWVMREER